MQPPKSILDKSFRYVPAAKSDIRKTFARIRAQLKAPKPSAEVRTLDTRRKLG